MDPLLLSAIIGGGVSIINSLFGYYGQKETNKDIAKQNKKQEELQREAWERENTAVQRRKADLEAAGLSPTLAAGSAAASSGPSISLKNQQSGIDKFALDMGILNQIAQIQMQKKTTDAQIKNIDQDTENKTTQGKILKNEEKLQTTYQANELAKLNGDLELFNINLERFRRENEIEKETREDKIALSKLTLEKIKTEIQKNEYDKAMKLSNTLINAFGTGALASNMANRNAILMQQMQKQKLGYF